MMQNGCPAAAFSSELLIENLDAQTITHSAEDTLSRIDTVKIAESAEAIADLIRNMEIST